MLADKLKNNCGVFSKLLSIANTYIAANKKKNAF